MDVIPSIEGFRHSLKMFNSKQMIINESINMCAQMKTE